jgi:hypothetical protein
MKISFIRIAIQIFECLLFYLLAFDDDPQGSKYATLNKGRIGL